MSKFRQDNPQKNRKGIALPVPKISRIQSFQALELQSQKIAHMGDLKIPTKVTKTEVIVIPIQIMRYGWENHSKVSCICIKFDPSNMGR